MKANTSMNVNAKVFRSKAITFSSSKVRVPFMKRPVLPGNLINQQKAFLNNAYFTIQHLPITNNLHFFILFDNIDLDMQRRKLPTFQYFRRLNYNG